MRELKGFHEEDSFKNGVFMVELVNDDIYEWDVKIFKIDTGSTLYPEFVQWKEKTGKDHILLHISYGDNYPFSPPFVRLVYPKLTHGIAGWGGGLLCLELLKARSWSSAYTIEPLVLQVQATISGTGLIRGTENEQFTYQTAKAAVDEYFPEETDWRSRSDK
uniref:Ubiquitin-conjugating enzyme E2 Q1 n=1 Tax=Aceria tosichella TaxID=561515 RepID=A0A6G1SMI1_9ACAR